MATPHPVFTPPAEGASRAPVLDVEAGVERLMGNRTIYLRALARFRTDYCDAGAAIGRALAGGDLALAQRLVHTLKGAAGMIEAGALQAAALALEGALRSDPAAADARLLRLDNELGQVLRELDALLPAEQQVTHPVDSGPAPVARLRAMLDIGDGAAVELLAGARAALCAELGEAAWLALNEAVADFDYERALALLDQSGQAGA